MVKLRLDLKKNEWVELPKGSREQGSIYLDGVLYQSFQSAKKVMEKKSVDLVVVCSGYPGSGKSKLISQIASFCDPTFTEDRMYQTSKDFQEGVLKEDQILRAHVLDEAWEGLSSSQVRREVGRLFMSLMNTIRQKRLFIFLVLPDFFDLTKNIAIFRSRWLIHCYSETFGDVGRFVCFDRRSKKQLYLKGKQFENYSAVPADFRGVFTNADSPRFNWERYENEIKPKAMELITEKEETERGSVKQRNRLLLILKLKHKWKLTKLSEILGIDYKYVSKITTTAERNEDPDFLKELEGEKDNNE